MALTNQTLRKTKLRNIKNSTSSISLAKRSRKAWSIKKNKWKWIDNLLNKITLVISIRLAPRILRIVVLEAIIGIRITIVFSFYLRFQIKRFIKLITTLGIIVFRMQLQWFTILLFTKPKNRLQVFLFHPTQAANNSKSTVTVYQLKRSSGKKTTV
jgi:hypothetical protein